MPGTGDGVALNRWGRPIDFSKPPKSPCYNCGAMHWRKDCSFTNRDAARAATATSLPTPPPSAPTKHHTPSQDSHSVASPPTSTYAPSARIAHADPALPQLSDVDDWHDAGPGIAWTATALSATVTAKEGWYIDSGASHMMSGDRSLFASLRPIQPEPIRLAEKGSVMYATTMDRRAPSSSAASSMAQTSAATSSPSPVSTA
jgi:hypothetical protein